MVNIFLYCFLPIKFWYYKCFELSLAATIARLKPVLCDHVTSINNDYKEARDVGLTCWCYLSNNMPGSIFHESMWQGIIFFFVDAGWYFLLSSRWKRWNQFYHYKINGRGEILSYNRLSQIGLISFPWDLKSWTCQWISH